ncbi:hypothetical protein Ade02nite_55100 [Paractinoplanes deccanensis]|uniref:Uncharacterized protein n=1 Tax=Paractinoplanes deccanensis TaxID=113561 RepID=A0ABQ3YA31_9ACTN|nr:hypothetical protein [Actinoplanes deccanensis]GID76869.1 hypothetical protein Ade02nite_55100 [Actinoplanes deccanensis]
MTEDLRALLRADLNAERPPPLGDVVGAALRDGKRIQRHRRWLAAGGGAVGVLAAVVVGGGVLSVQGPGVPASGVVGVAAAPSAAVPSATAPGSSAGGPGGDEFGLSGGAAQRVAPTVTAPGRNVEKPAGFPPGSVPTGPGVPASPAAPRTFAVVSGTHTPVGTQKKATAAAMVYLLEQLLPPGLTGSYSVAAGGELRVQAYLNDGRGPGMVRVGLSREDAGAPRPPRGGTAKVVIVNYPDDCERNTSVSVGWPDGTVVQLDIASCLAFDGVSNPPARPPLDPDLGVKIAADPRWGLLMDGSLVDKAAAMYSTLPVFAG